MARRLTLDFLRTEAASGVLIAVAAVIAMALANSPAAGAYFGLLDAPLPVQIGGWRASLTVQAWVRDGLMALFFFVLGLEAKHEVLKGELANPRRLVLPLGAALGGMIAPAAVYLLVNAGADGHLRGWTVPTGTDIAWALALFAAVGRGLPASLRVFLMTLALVGDLGAAALAAIAFSHGPDLTALAAAALALAAMGFLQRGRRISFVYPLVGFVLVWGFARQTGINPALAGLAAALTVPAAAPRPGEESPLKTYLAALHPWVAFGVLPAFAFTAAGVSLAGLTPAALVAPTTLGVALGLFLGKQLGVFGATALAVTSGLAKRPGNAAWLEIYGVAALCGAGLTMSLFLDALAFSGGEPGMQAQARLGVLAGSLLSSIWGVAFLAWAAARRRARGDAEAVQFAGTA